MEISEILNNISYELSCLSSSLNKTNFFKDYGVLITATTTLLASIVALFKDGIYNFFMQPKLSYSESCEKHFKTVKNDESDSDDNEIISYIYEIDVKNEGKSICKNAEMYLEKIEYKKDDNSNMYQLDLIDDSILRSNGTNKDINKRPMKFELLKISKFSNENNSQSSSKPTLLIGAYSVPNNLIGGTYKVSFSIYSDNAKTLNIKFTLHWNGAWESNLDDLLKKSVKVVVEK